MEHQIQSNQENYPSQISRFEEGLFQFLQEFQLPTDDIFVDVSERVRVINNFRDVVSILDAELKIKSIYLSKFIAASASGLFDAALNYLWDETILQLRNKIAKYDLDYFYDNTVSGERRSKFRNVDDLVNLQDSDLIVGARKIELISEIGLKHLTYINYLRNWASAAHPNQNEITGLQLISWLETCIKEVINVNIPANAVKIKKLLSNIRKNPISADNANEMAVFLAELSTEQCNSLGLSFFGIYTSVDTDEMLRQNVKLLLPRIWDGIENDTRESFGLKYAYFSAHHEKQSKSFAREFLEIVDGQSYIPDDLRIVEIKKACDDLKSAHRRMNNFYNEPVFIEALERVIGKPPKIPKSINKDYVFTIVECFITNGHGVAVDAEPQYKNLIKKFNSSQATLALLAFNDEQISSNLQFPLCELKFKELLGYIKPILTNPSTLSLLNEVDQFQGGYKNLKSDSRIKRSLANLKQLIK